MGVERRVDRLFRRPGYRAGEAERDREHEDEERRRE
jgi:hypothetical protein